MLAIDEHFTKVLVASVVVTLLGTWVFLESCAPPQVHRVQLVAPSSSSMQFIYIPLGDGHILVPYEN